MRHFSFAWVVFALVAAVAVAEPASARVTIYDWRHPAPAGVMQPRDLGAMRVIELNPGEVSRSLPILRLGTHKVGNSMVPRQAQVSCLSERTDEENAVGRDRLRGRSLDESTNVLFSDTGALVKDDTVVICRPEESRSRTHYRARVRVCEYFHRDWEWAAWIGRGNWSVYREHVDIVFSGIDGSFAGVPSERARNEVKARARDSRSFSLAEAVLFASCPQTVPSVVNPNESATLYSAKLSKTWGPISFSGLVNDELPRAVGDVVDAIQRGEDTSPAIPGAWLVILDAANARARRPAVMP